MAYIRLSDPLTNPSAPGFTKATLINNLPTYQDRLPGGKVYSLQGEAQYWGIILTYEDLIPDEISIIEADLLKGIINGNRFQVILPHLENYRVSGDTNTTTITAGQQGANLVISNYNLTGIPKRGDIMSLSNHKNKVYKITSVNLTGTTLTLGIFPNLVAVTTGLEKPIFNNVLFTLVIDDPSAIQQTINETGLFDSFSLNLSEDIS